MAATLAYALVALVAARGPAQVLVVGSARGDAQQRTAAARTLDKSKLAQLLRQDVVPKLPVGARLVRIEADEAVDVPRGKLEVDVTLPDQLEGGMQYASATLRSARGTQRVPVRLTLAMLTAQGRLAPVVKRGAEVVVIVRTGNVLVQSMGTAQENGGIEQSISVIPNASGRVIRGRVKDARTVEVAL